MTALRVSEKAANIDALVLSLSDQGIPSAGPGQCVVKIHSAGVNPSDVKATLGAMPHAVWPRTPGRDYAGVVVEGPSDLLGKEVWGSGGELGIRRDGSHAQYLVVDIESVREKPGTLSMLEASAVGVPFVTAYEGFRRAGLRGEDHVVLVLGANGKVGQAAVQMATRAGARVFAVARRESRSYRGFASGPVTMIDASDGPISEQLRDLTNGHGADIVFNTVGSPYFEQANLSMAFAATQILISTLERPVPFDIFTFYRGQHTFVGVDTLGMDSVAGARVLHAISPWFEDGSLQPFPVMENNIYSLENAMQAYRSVLGGAQDRIVVRP